MSDYCPSENMVHDHIETLTELKTVQRLHTESIATLSVSLENMNKSFNQIKWSIFGAVALYILDNIGFIDFIKTVL